uniref:VOC family protein n=1 Tax=Deinococcus sp. TaxID=47478 RepID=UPI0025E1D27F
MTPLTPFRLNKALSVGPVALSVSDLSRSLAFYTQVLGLVVLRQDGHAAELGVPGRALLKLRELSGAPRAPGNSPGLFHLALLLPSRAELGQLVRRIAATGVRLGQGDHLVSEAFYLNDPDGHGIEIYYDRPQDTWQWQAGEVVMGSEPVNIASLLAEAGPEAPYSGLPGGTVMGHVHLRVSDIAATEVFYSGVLGFDVTSRWSGQALFISVGGYHHHLGLNTWHSAGGRAAPEHSLKLEEAQFYLPGVAEVDRLAGRLHEAGVA